VVSFHPYISIEILEALLFKSLFAQVDLLWLDHFDQSIESRNVEVPVVEHWSSSSSIGFCSFGLMRGGGTFPVHPYMYMTLS
jgi:hypothetical protein